MKKRKSLSADDKILRQAAKNYQHSREAKGTRVVQCYVSERFLSFPDTSDLLDDGNDLMFVDVMTRDVEGDAKKLCELILDRRGLIVALEGVRSVPFKRRNKDD